MNNLKQTISSEYDLIHAILKDLQGEVEQLVNMIVESNSNSIDVAQVSQRPGNDIKDIVSILKNLDEGKYKNITSIVDIKDIAGVRVTCHCEDDVENLSTLLVGKLQQKYETAEIKAIGGRNSEYPYSAKHILVSKSTKINGEDSMIFCEIQLRTVMADAWAVQNHKYLYKKETEGDTNELSIAVSEIMTGCEKLWSLVKKRTIKDDEILQPTQQTKLAQDKPSTQIFNQPDFGVSTWIEQQRNSATTGLSNIGIEAFMEVCVEINTNKRYDLTLLRDAAQKSTISTFGWPIGVFLGNRNEYKPKVAESFIWAELPIEKHNIDGSKTYDYWAIHNTASFYLLKSLFEDTRKPGIVSFNTRIIRITEVFMYLRNLHSLLEIKPDTQFEITIKHSGIKNRFLTTLSPNRIFFDSRVSGVDQVSTQKRLSISDFVNDPASVVGIFTDKLFEKFDFFELDRNVLEQIVNDYLEGKVT